MNDQIHENMNVKLDPARYERIDLNFRFQYGFSIPVDEIGVVEWVESTPLRMGSTPHVKVKFPKGEILGPAYWFKA